MRLLDLSQFEPIIQAIGSRRIGLIDGMGNTGDRLLQQATRLLLDEFGCQWRTINIVADGRSVLTNNIDVLLLWAGGLMGVPGECGRPNRTLSQLALETGIPCVALPRTYIGLEEGCYETVFVRETTSLIYNASAHLAPDLALSMIFRESCRPTFPRGLFLRSGYSHFPAAPRNDPADLCWAPQEYVDLASQYSWIVTDRLHFAITALGIGRRVTLLPIPTHKNRSVYDTWLKDLGCEWSDNFQIQ